MRGTSGSRGNSGGQVIDQNCPAFSLLGLRTTGIRQDEEVPLPTGEEGRRAGEGYRKFSKFNFLSEVPLTQP